MPNLYEVRIRYIPRRGGNPHLIRDIWVKCPDCGKERWTDQKWFLKHDTLGLCLSCSARRRRKEQLYIPVKDRRVLRRPDGYTYIHLPTDHWCVPMSRRKGNSHRIMLHRLIMAEYLGRLLEPWEIVHHINGIRDDNRIENLQLTTRKKHGLSYQEGYAQGLKDGIAVRDKSLEKQMKLLQWQIKDLGEALQLKLGEEI